MKENDGVEVELLTAGRSRAVGAALTLVVILAGVSGGDAVAVEPLPWEVWQDLGELARLRMDHQVVMRSSRCPDGCPYDRHSDGDSRFLRVTGQEGVIFEVEGPGAITRIWMTQGDQGTSMPLDPNIRLRLTLDGAADPVVDLPLPEAFGVAEPFTAPLAVDRTVSSGGNISFVPMPFRQGARLSLVGAEAERIWFQVTGHRLASPDGVTSFSGDEDLSAWRAMLDSAGADPWVNGSSHPSISGVVTIQPGATEVVADLQGPDSLTALLLDAPRGSWPELELVLDFDERQKTEMSFPDFFAVGRAGAEPTRSLMIGTDDQERLYSYFPMPFFRSARLSVRLADTAQQPVAVDFSVRRRDQTPTADSGYFGAELGVVETSVAGQDSTVVELDGPGRWVGLFLEAGSVGSTTRAFLEGDERIHIDGSTHPFLYGTGVEDFFGGGFYFRVDSTVSTPFRRALHGMTYELTDPVGRAMGMYRLMLTDAPFFGSDLAVGLEGGPENQTPVRLRSVAYFYRRPTSGLRSRDVLDVGDPGSRVDHLYAWTGDQECSQLDGLFENEPPTHLIAERCNRGIGSSSFVLRGARPGQRLVLRRRLDATNGDQRAIVDTLGVGESRLDYEDPNPFRQWREKDWLIGTATGDDPELAFTVDVTSQDGGDALGFTESLWELRAGYPPGVCDLVLDGDCDAADLSEAVRAVDGGAPVDDLLIPVDAVFD